MGGNRKVKTVFLLPCFFVFLLFRPVDAESIEVSGFEGDTTHWSADTVFVTGNLTAYQGTYAHKELIIDPGVVIYFTGPYHLRFFEGNYTIRAEGTPDDSIVFTSPDSVRWRGIQIDRRDDYIREKNAIVFSYCTFEHCKGGTVRFVGNDSLTTASITHCGFFGNDSGAALSFSAPGCAYHFFKTEIAYNRFMNNATRYEGGAIHVVNTAVYYRVKDTLPVTQTIENNLFSGNSAASGGAVFIEGDKLLLRNNRFENNTARYEGGAIYLKLSSSLVVNNIFTGNSVPFDPENPPSPGTDGGGAILIMTGSDTLNIPVISGNLITENSGLNGGAIHCNDAAVLIVNNTICNNVSTYGGALYWESSGGFRKCVNTIFWGNRTVVDTGAQIYLWRSHPEFHHCVIEGGVGSIWQDTGFIEEGKYEVPFANCLAEYPEFADTATGSFRLSKNSPCINAGIFDTAGLFLPAFDLDSAIRITDDTVDIGCHEFVPSTETVSFGRFPDVSGHQCHHSIFLHHAGGHLPDATGKFLTLTGRQLRPGRTGHIPSGMYLTPSSVSESTRNRSRR